MSIKTLNEDLNRLEVDEYKMAAKIPLIVILDNVRSMNNIGSVFRTSDAFRVEEIVLCGITACPPHKEIQKTALGATESVKWRYVESCPSFIKDLKEDNYVVLGIEQASNSVMLDDFFPDKNNKYAIVFGNEVDGVGQDSIDLCDNCIEIPQFGTKHSINISVCAGITIWHFYQALKSCIHK